MKMGEMPNPHTDEIEALRPFEQPPERFGAEHLVPAPALEAEVLGLGDLEDTDIDPVSFDREDFVPSEALVVSPEAYNKDELLLALHSIGSSDSVGENSHRLLDPTTATARALEVYDLYASDTSFPPQEAVAEYLYALTEGFLGADRLDVQPENLEKLYVGIIPVLKRLDSELIHAA